MLEMVWFGLIVMLIGMLVVFVGLVILIWAVKLMSFAASKIDARREIQEK